jgi:DNA-binding HxlR family transcriptional regulator
VANLLENDQSTIDLLNSLRQEIASLRKDMNRIEESVLKQRLLAIEETLSQNHLLVYASQRSETIDEDISCMLKSDCDKKGKCSEYFKAKIEDSSRAIKESGPKKALLDIDNKIAESEIMVEKTKGEKCEACFANFNKKLKREKRAYQEIVLVENINKTKSPEAIDTQFLVDSLFEPLANHSRLKILFSVSKGKRSFSELSRIVDLKAGHLAFHLKKLVDANLMAQEASKGDYVITQGGLKLIKTVSALSMEASATSMQTEE